MTPIGPDIRERRDAQRHLSSKPASIRLTIQPRAQSTSTDVESLSMIQSPLTVTWDSNTAPALQGIVPVSGSLNKSHWLLAARRILGVTFALALLGSVCSAQIPSETDATSTPVPNAGHDYIQGFSEIVNPANGSLSLRLGVPMPPGRGLTVPFSFNYDSNGSVYLGTPLCLGCSTPTWGVKWLSTTSMLAHGGWSYGVPMLSVQSDSFTVETLSPTEVPGTFICKGMDNFVMQDASGNRRNLGLSYYNTNQNCQNSDLGGQAVTSTDTQYGALLAQTTSKWTGTLSGDSGAVNPVTATEGDGTAYYFGSAAAPDSNTCSGKPCTATTYPPEGISDRNGNTLAISFSTTSQSSPAVSYTDSVGRQVLSIPKFGADPDTVTVYGFSNPYQVYWTTVTPNFTISMTLVSEQNNESCPAPGTQPSVPAVSSIALPNGQSYTFDYSNNPYGMVDKITYPTGGYVRYVWGSTHKVSMANGQ